MVTASSFWTYEPHFTGKLQCPSLLNEALHLIITLFLLWYWYRFQWAICIDIGPWYLSSISNVLAVLLVYSPPILGRISSGMTPSLRSFSLITHFHSKYAIIFSIHFVHPTSSPLKKCSRSWVSQLSGFFPTFFQEYFNLFSLVFTSYLNIFQACSHRDKQIIVGLRYEVCLLLRGQFDCLFLVYSFFINFSRAKCAFFSKIFKNAFWNLIIKNIGICICYDIFASIN